MLCSRCITSLVGSSSQRIRVIASPITSSRQFKILLASSFESFSRVVHLCVHCQLVATLRSLVVHLLFITRESIPRIRLSLNAGDSSLPTETPRTTKTASGSRFRLDYKDSCRWGSRRTYLTLAQECIVPHIVTAATVFYSWHSASDLKPSTHLTRLVL